VKQFEGDIHNETFEVTARQYGVSAQSSCGDHYDCIEDIGDMGIYVAE